jgi:type IV pilus modification protein PilV
MKNCRNHRRNQAKSRGCQASGGFTLIEVMIAVFLLAFGLLAAAQMQGSSIRYNAMGKQMTSAIAYAESVMEKERIRGTTPEMFDQITKGETVVQYGQNADFPDFQRRVTITDSAEVPPLMKTIAVSIEWRGFLFRSYTIRSVIARPPTLGGSAS